MDYTEIVSKAQIGDSQAITALYNETYKQAYSVALQITKNEEEAFDILQDSYIKAFNNLHTLADKSKFKSWLFQIVSNKCKDYLKSKRHDLVYFSEMTYETDSGEQEVEFEDESTSFSPQEQVDYNETKRLIAEMMNNLPEDQKLVLLMYYVQELSIKEIAESLEVSENTVKSRMNYGKKKLKLQVEELEKKGTKLYGITGFALNMVGILRNLIFTYLGKKNNQKALKYARWILAVVFAGIGFWRWEGTISILIIFAKVLSTCAYGTTNMKKMRIMLSVTCVCWICYNYYIGSVAGVISDGCNFVSVIIGIIRYDIMKKEEKAL